MSAIASATASQFSPLSRLKSELASEVSAGTVNSADQSALSSALDDIDSAMQANKPSAGSARPSRDEMQSKISDLIDGEVSSGKLTSDQADELKNVFSSAFKGGPGGPGGAGGPPPGPPPSGVAGSSDSSSSTSSSGDVSKMLSDFLQTLMDSNSKSSSYGASGDSLTSQLQSLIVDYQA